MSDDRERRIALLLRGLSDLDREKVTYVTEWKDRRQKLEDELFSLREEILSNQQPLPLEVA